MTELVEMTDSDKQRFEDFKRKINKEAAAAQVSKLEYNLTDASLDKAVLRRACQEAENLGLGAVCVLPCNVKSCVNFLGRDPKASLIACISFPHGGDTTQVKVAAVKQAVKDGMDEAEVSAPVSAVKDGNWSYIKKQFKKVKSAAKNRSVRISIESTYFTEHEVIKLVNLAADCGITSVRVSSGDFQPEIIAKVKCAVKDKCTVKADGVSTLADMQTAVDMGAGIVGSKRAQDLAHLIYQTVEE